MQINRKTLALIAAFSGIAFYFSEIQALASTKDSSNRILYIGNSHTAGILGTTLNRLLRKLPVDSVSTVGSCGSSPAWWYPSKKFKNGVPTGCGYFEQIENNPPVEAAKHATPLFLNLLAQLKPTHLLIEQGPNLWDFFDDIKVIKDRDGKKISVKKSPEELKADRDYATSDLQMMAKDAFRTKAKCVWVGQPDSRKKGPKEKLQAFAEFIKSAVTPFGCVYVDSIKFTKYPKYGGDGLHYWGSQGGLAACHWAVSVFLEFEKETGLSAKMNEKDLMTGFCKEYISDCEAAKAKGKDVDCSY